MRFWVMILGVSGVLLTLVMVGELVLLSQNRPDAREASLEPASEAAELAEARARLISEMQSLEARLDARDVELNENFVRSYQQLKTPDQRVVWRRELMEKAREIRSVAFLVDVADYTDDIQLQSDLLYCLQELLGLDLLMEEGVTLSPEASSAFRRQVRRVLAERAAASGAGVLEKDPNT